jgi:hypothetical protein
MPITLAPPQPVPIVSGFDYVAVDERRHRAYAAHTPSRRLLVVDTMTGKVVTQISVGPLHGIAVDPHSGAVYTDNGTDHSLSKVDPSSMKVLATLDVRGNLDAIVYDARRDRIYADQADGGAVYVVDGATMRQLGTIAMPASALEAPDVDPATGMLYQNLANGGGFAIVDPASLTIVKVVSTPQLQSNHPLVFSHFANQVIVGGVNGILAAYTPDGHHIGDVPVQPHIDQCATGSKGRLVICAGRGIVTMLLTQPGGAPRVAAWLDTGHPTLHTVGIDESTDQIWVVYSDARGDWVQSLKWMP